MDLQEHGTITDIFCEGIARVEVFGPNARLIFWRWRYDPAKKEWQRVALDMALIAPLAAFAGPCERWCEDVVYIPENKPTLIVVPRGRH